MTIMELRLLPPLAFARFGSASEPQDNFEIEENPTSLGFRRIIPADTLIVETDGTVTIRRAADSSALTRADLNKMFRDGANIRPVAPFFELWAITDEDEDKLVPLTVEQLEKHDFGLSAIAWRVHVENRKVFRRTGERDDIVTAETDWFSGHTRMSLRGKSPRFDRGKEIEFGFAQFIKPDESDPICSRIQLRFTPGPGKIYGPTGMPPLPYVTPIYDYQKGPWFAFSESNPGKLKPDWDVEHFERWPRQTLPSSLYAIAPPAPPWLNNNRAHSLGYLDDACDGFIEVRCGKTLRARARICVGPPGFVPDSRFIRTLADDLDQVVHGPEAKDLDIREARTRALDIVRRAYEAVRFMNVAVMNGNEVVGRSPTEFDTMPAEESFGTERPLRPVMSPASVDTAAIVALHQQVFAALSAGAVPWFLQLLRKPNEIGDLTDRGRRKMPALMSGADSFYLALTNRQIATIEKATQAGLSDPETLPTGDRDKIPTLSPRNLTAQLHHRAAGNPVSSRPEMAIANCCPGLEVDFRAVWRRLFEGIELSEHENIVVTAKGVDADGRPLESLVDHRLLRVGITPGGVFEGGKLVIVTLQGPSPANPEKSVTVASNDNPHGVWTMEWSNCLAHVVDGFRAQGIKEIWCEFTAEVASEPQPVKMWVEENSIKVRLRVRNFFEDNTAVISDELAEPGELTQGLCSPWQNDLRECSCYYWASSRPDFINTSIGDDGLSRGDNWFAKTRTGEYVPDDYVDPRLIGYEDLFKNWEQLQFQIGGKDSAPDLLNQGVAPRRRS
jgi:hypothetical protein